MIVDQNSDIIVDTPKVGFVFNNEILSSYNFSILFSKRNLLNMFYFDRTY